MIFQVIAFNLQEILLSLRVSRRGVGIFRFMEVKKEKKNWSIFNLGNWVLFLPASGFMEGAILEVIRPSNQRNV